MRKKAVTSKKVSATIAPYTPAIESGGFLFISGQVALDSKTGKAIRGGIEAQTKEVLEKVKSLLEADRLTMDDVVSVNVYLMDVKDFGKMNEVYKQYFSKPPLPARTTVQAPLVREGLLVEISAIANAK